MELERYEFEPGQKENMYEFYSEGPKGRIKKVVVFGRMPFSSATLYNLSFGDWDEETNWINDRIVSDNKDRRKILATVAAIVLAFTEKDPVIKVFATGSTPARTRLYQMGITSVIAEISIQHEVFGYRNNNWELFQEGIQYSSFYIRWKKT